MSPHLRIAKSEVLRILLAWHARLGREIPRLADALEDGPETFHAAWDTYTATSLADVVLELEAAADDGPRAA